MMRRSVKLITEEHKCRNSIVTGGAAKDDVDWMCEEARGEQCNVKPANLQAPKNLLYLVLKMKTVSATYMSIINCIHSIESFISSFPIPNKMGYQF